MLIKRRREIPHGTESCYFNRRCRCDDCRAAHNREARRRAAEKRANRVDKPKPGKSGRIYFYGVPNLNKCYIGKDGGTYNRRLRDHAHGRFEVTAELNREAAEAGLVPQSICFPVDCSQYSLDWWERYYADKYRAAGWTLVNRAPLTLAGYIAETS